ncbi:MAG: flagellar export chaperone FliS [Sedimentisphaerales bacterium]|nr:flagellar export chaperone FliS [Sedimentisphaerales bacterium]
MTAKNATPNEYLKTKVLTASPEQLQLMLYDGAIRFCEQARCAIEQGEIEGSYNLITRAENIIMELTKSMRDEVAPETCDNMRRLYLYCYEQLVEANTRKDVAPLENALRILRHLRQTWELLMEKIRREQAAGRDSSGPSASGQDPPAGAGETLDPSSLPVGATLNVEG